MTDIAILLDSTSLSLESVTPVIESAAELVVLNNELINVLLDRLCVAALLVVLVVLTELAADATSAPVDSSYVIVAFCGVISNVNDPLLLSMLLTTGNVLDVIERLAALVSVYSTNVTRLTVLSV